MSNITIDNYEFHIEPFLPKEGLRIVAKLVRIIGPAIASADDMNVAASLVLENLDDKPVIELIDKLAENTRFREVGSEKWQHLRQNTDGFFNMVFAQNKLGYMGMMQWASFAFKEQFSGFFDMSKVQGMFPGLDLEKEKDSQSQSPKE